MGIQIVREARIVVRGEARRIRKHCVMSVIEKERVRHKTGAH